MTSRVFLAPSWLLSSVDRAPHRYHRGHRFTPRTGLIFFFSGPIFATVQLVGIALVFIFISYQI